MPRLTHAAAFILFILFLTGCSASQSGAHPPFTATAPYSGKVKNRCPAPFYELERLKPKGPLIAIDAGHGGKDMGAHAKKPMAYEEKNLTLATVRQLEKSLQRMGFQTLIIRGDDTYLPLEERANIANEAHAKLFVSVHYNSASNKNAEGTEVYYFQGESSGPRCEQSKKLANAVLSSIATNMGAKSRGVKHGNFAVIRETKMPAILIEGGFLTNEKELANIQDEGWRRQLAWSIAQGVNGYTSGR